MGSRIPQWRGRPLKEIVREKTARPDAAYKSMLTLPGTNLAEFDVFLANGAITRHTHITMIERNACAATVIQKAFARKFAKTLPNYRIVNTELSDYKPDRAFDFLNLDLMGSINLDLIQWLKTVPLIPGADLSINLAAPRKNGEFYDRLKRVFLLYGDGKNFLRKLRDDFPHINDEDNLDQVNMVTLAAALNKYDADILPREKGDNYTDCVIKMHFYRFWDVHPTKRRKPSIDALLDQETAPYIAEAKNNPQGEGMSGALGLLWHQAEQSGNARKINYVKQQIRKHMDGAALRGKNPNSALGAIKAWKTRYDTKARVGI